MFKSEKNGVKLIEQYPAPDPDPKKMGPDPQHS